MFELLIFKSDDKSARKFDLEFNQVQHSNVVLSRSVGPFAKGFKFDEIIVGFTTGLTNKDDNGKLEIIWYDDAAAENYDLVQYFDIQLTMRLK